MPSNSYSLLPSMQFRGFADPKANLNPEVISGLVTDLEQDYRRGETYVDQMQEAILKLPVAPGDFENLKNVSQEYEQNAKALADKYQGRYEDAGFQREVKSLNARYAEDTRLRNLVETEKNVRQYQSIMNDPTKRGAVVDFTEDDPDSFDSFKNGVFKPKLEERYDYFEQAKEFYAHIKNDIYTTDLKATSTPEGFATYVSDENNWEKISQAIDDAYDKYIETNAGLQHYRVRVREHLQEGMGQEEAESLAKDELRAFLGSVGDSYKQKILQNHYMNLPKEDADGGRSSNTVVKPGEEPFSTEITIGIDGNPYNSPAQSLQLNKEDKKAIEDTKGKLNEYMTEHRADFYDASGNQIVKWNTGENGLPILVKADGASEEQYKKTLNLHKGQLRQYELQARAAKHRINERREFMQEAAREAGYADNELVEMNGTVGTPANFLDIDRKIIEKGLQDFAQHKNPDGSTSYNVGGYWMTEKQAKEIAKDQLSFGLKTYPEGEEGRKQKQQDYINHLEKIKTFGNARGESPQANAKIDRAIAEASKGNFGWDGRERAKARYEEAKENLYKKDPRLKKLDEIYKKKAEVQQVLSYSRGFGTSSKNREYKNELEENIQQNIAADNISIYDVATNQEVSKQDALKAVFDSDDPASEIKKRVKLTGWDMQPDNGIVHYVTIYGGEGQENVAKTYEVRSYSNASFSKYLANNKLVNELLFQQEVMIDQGLEATGQRRTVIGVPGEGGKTHYKEVEKLEFDEGNAKEGWFKWTNFQGQIEYAPSKNDLIDQYFESLYRAEAIDQTSAETNTPSDVRDLELTNNPFNIRQGNEFKAYSTLQEGVIAGARQVERYRNNTVTFDKSVWKDSKNPDGGAEIKGDVTLDNFVYTYAPKSDNNNPENYLTNIIQIALGYSKAEALAKKEELRNLSLKSIDFTKLMEAIVRTEGAVDWNVVKNYL